MVRLVSSRKTHVFVLACSILLLPIQQTLAANPIAAHQGHPSTPAGSPVLDVALLAGGVMQGQVVDAQGKACRDARVRLLKMGSGGEVLASATTDARGQFQFTGIQAGIYRVQTRGVDTTCRLWAPSTAPPAASPAALLVQGEPAVRGNLGGISPLGWALIGIGVAAAIAIPLALDDDDAS